VHSLFTSALLQSLLCSPARSPDLSSETMRRLSVSVTKDHFRSATQRCFRYLTYPCCAAIIAVPLPKPEAPPGRSCQLHLG